MGPGHNQRGTGKMQEKEDKEAEIAMPMPFVDQETVNTMYDLLGKVLSDRAYYVEALRLQVLLEPFVQRLAYLAIPHDVIDVDGGPTRNDLRDYSSYSVIHLQDDFE